MSVEDLKYRMSRGIEFVGEVPLAQGVEDLKHINGQAVLTSLRTALRAVARIEEGVQHAGNITGVAKGRVEIGTSIIHHASQETNNDHAKAAREAGDTLSKGVGLQASRLGLITANIGNVAALLSEAEDLMDRLTPAITMAQQSALELASLQATVVNETQAYIDEQ
jgi:hypothetical protein